MQPHAAFVDPSMNLPSAADLVRAFVKDLGNVLDTDAGAVRKTRSLAFISGGAAATFQWKADADYFYIGCHSGAGAQVTVSTSGQANPALGTKASWVGGDILHITPTTTATTVPAQHAFIPKDTTVTVVINAAQVTALLVFEYA